MNHARISLIGNLYLDRAYVLPGQLFQDQTNLAESAYDQVGGLANVARGLRDLNRKHRPTIYSSLGGDAAGQILTAKLEAEDCADLAIETIEDAATTTATILIDRSKGQRTSVVSFGACTEAPLPEVTDANWCHVAYLDCLHGAELDDLLALGSRGATVSADLCRSDLDDSDRRRLLTLFAALDYLLLSDVECRALLGTADEAAAKQLGRAVRGVAIVHHATGSWASDGNQIQTIDVGAHAPVEDVLGAGDAFAAGFIHHRQRGMSFATATEMAHDFATRSLLVRS